MVNLPIRKIKNVLRSIKHLIVSSDSRSDNAAIVEKLPASGKICVELGAGGTTRQGWISIDLA